MTLCPKPPAAEAVSGGEQIESLSSGKLIFQHAGGRFLRKWRIKVANGFDPRATIRPHPGATGVGQDSVAYHAGLRSYMLSVYNYMASGVLLTGIVALLFANSGMAAQILGGPSILKYVIMLAPLAFVLVLSFGINRLSTGTAQLLFWAFATVMGLSMASIFLVYTGTSIATTFFAAAAAFACSATPPRRICPAWAPS